VRSLHEQLDGLSLHGAVFRETQRSEIEERLAGDPQTLTRSNEISRAIIRGGEAGYCVRAGSNELFEIVEDDERGGAVLEGM
jgi:hypothetical protein